MGQARDEAGNIWETDAQGNPVRLLQAAGAQQMPADPSFPYQGAQAQAQAANTGAEAQVNQATIGSQITAAQADATIKQRQARTAGLPEGFQWRDDGAGSEPIPGYTRQGLSPEVRQNAIQAYTDADALERAADDIEGRFKTGPGATSGLRGLADYFPTDANKLFNDAGQQARGYVKRALGFTGGEGNTVAESSALYDPYLPTAGDRDVQIEAKIAKLRELANDSRTKAMTTLGGIPDDNGNITPVREEQPNAMTQLRIGGGQGPTAAPFGSTQGGTATIPPEMTQELDQLTARLMQQNGGRLDPQAYAREGAAIANKYDFDPGDLAGWATGVNEYLDKGGKTVPSGARIENRELSGVDQFRNNLVSNPIGAGAAGFLDSGGFGMVSALAPDQMAALGDAQPVGTTIGQIGGAIGATGALARGTRFLAEAGSAAAGVAPRILGGGGAGQFGRNVATDAAYSGIYGANTGQDPLESAAWGAAGSVAGQGAGAAVGRAIGGVDLAPAVQFLRNRGIPMTVPQQLGGFIKGLEDKAMSAPLVGDMIRARRLEGLDRFNREAFNEAGGPIQATVTDLGQEGVQQLGDQVSDAYGSATAGVTVPFDDQFLQDFAGAVERGQALPPDLRRSLGEVLDARVAPITDTGQMTGEQFQQALRALKATRNRPPSRFEGFEQDYRDSVTGTMDALEGQMGRGAPQVAPALGAANAANRNLRTIEDATNRAAGGSETGTPFMFTPSQLQRAGMATERRFPGARPFAELADSGQAVLPSRVPNSGTADRAAQMLLPGAILGGGGLGALSGNDPQSIATGAGTGAGATALAALALLAGGSRTGQRALQRAVIDRPETMRQLGRQIRSRTGLFGSAALPFVIAE